VTSGRNNRTHVTLVTLVKGSYTSQDCQIVKLRKWPTQPKAVPCAENDIWATDKANNDVDSGIVFTAVWIQIWHFWR